MKVTKQSSQKLDALVEITAKKLDQQQPLDSAHDRIVAATKTVNGELDRLLAKARS